MEFSLTKCVCVQVGEEDFVSLPVPECGAGVIFGFMTLGIGVLFTEDLYGYSRCQDVEWAAVGTGKVGTGEKWPLFSSAHPSPLSPGSPR